MCHLLSVEVRVSGEIYCFATGGGIENNTFSFRVATDAMIYIVQDK